MENRDSKRVKEYIKKENNYTDLIMAQTAELQKNIHNEIKKRCENVNFSDVIKINEYFYYWRIKKGMQYKVYFRKKFASKKEEVVLDLNKIAKGHKYFLIDDFKISKNNTFVAYLINTTGTEKYVMYIKKIATRKIIQKIVGVWDLEWLDDNTLIYTTIDKRYRSYKAYISKYTHKFKKNKLLYEEKDASYYLSIKKSGNGEFIFLYSIGINSTEIRYINIENYENGFKLLFKRDKKNIYYIEYFDKYFYILTNVNAPNFKLVRTPINNKLMKKFEVLIPNNKNNKLESFKVFRGYIAVISISNATNKIIILNILTRSKRFIKTPIKQT